MLQPSTQDWNWQTREEQEEWEDPTRGTALPTLWNEQSGGWDSFPAWMPNLWLYQKRVCNPIWESHKSRVHFSHGGANNLGWIPSQSLWQKKPTHNRTSWNLSSSRKVKGRFKTHSLQGEGSPRTNEGQKHHKGWIEAKNIQDFHPHLIRDPIWLTSSENPPLPLIWSSGLAFLVRGLFFLISSRKGLL